MNVNVKNEKVKRNFFKWLKEADGCADNTIRQIEKVIWLYEDYTDKKDLKLFTPDIAIGFKKWLKERRFRDKSISTTTQSTYLRYLRKFFKWICMQPGYKSMKPDSIDYLSLSSKEEKMSNQPTLRNFPSLEYVVKLAASIKGKTEVDMRDRAMIALTFLTGIRETALITLPLGCFDEKKLIVFQNPKMGVQTKFSKYIETHIIPLDKNLTKHILKWAEYLKTKGFGSKDPLFPSSARRQHGKNLSFEKALFVQPSYWENGRRVRDIFEQRSKDAGLPYFSPHTFRHGCLAQSLKSCRSGEEIKALSQNFGHEYVATTFASYGNYDSQRLSDILQSMEFSGQPKKSIDERMKSIEKLLLDKQHKTL